MSQGNLIKFLLNQEEVKQLNKHPKGQGGFQDLLLTFFDSKTNTFTLNDENLGQVIRYMGYGPGGFQSTLRQVFSRSINELMSGNRQK